MRAQQNRGSVFLLDHPIVLSRAAARIFGLDAAVVAQQFVYWTLDANCSLGGTVDERGNKWVYFSMDDLAKEFDWVSKSTVKRIVSSLESCGFLISRQSDCYSPKEYRVDRDVFEAIEAGRIDRIDPETGKLAGPPLAQNEPATSVKIEPTSSVKIEPTTNTYTSSPNSLAPGSAKPRKERARDLLMDALASVESDDLSTFNKVEWSRIAKAKQTLLESKPDASPDDVKRLRLAYIKAFPRASITAMALVNNFSKLWASANPKAAPMSHKEMIHHSIYG